MFKTLAFSLATIALLAGSVVAQSGNRKAGSSNREGSNTRADSQVRRQKETSRENAAATLKYAGLIQRGEFASVELTRDQKTALKALISENIEALNSTTLAMVNALPEDNRNAFQRAFLNAREEGHSASASVNASLASLEVAEATQQQVIELNGPRQAVVDRITTGVTALLTAEQQQTLAAATVTAAGSGTTTAGSAAKQPAGSGVKPVGSGTRPTPAPAGSTKKAGSSSR